MSASTESPGTTHNYVDEKGRGEPVTGSETHNGDRRASKAMGEKSPGVARVEAISSVLTTKDRIALFSSVFLIAYAYGLDGTLRVSTPLIPRSLSSVWSGRFSATPLADETIFPRPLLLCSSFRCLNCTDFFSIHTNQQRSPTYKCR